MAVFRRTVLVCAAALLLSGCVRTQPPDESDGGTARPDMPAPAPTPAEMAPQ